jgi:type I restriction enzyme, S subunit
VNWSFAPLGTVADIQLGKMLSPKSRTGASSFPYLRNVNVQWGRLDLSDLIEMDFDEADREKFDLRQGDLLVCEGGEPGRSAVVEHDLPGVFFQKALMRVRPLNRRIDTRFLQRFMEDAARRGTFAKDGNQVTIAHFPAVKLNALQVPLPPLDEQRRIANVLDRADVIRRKRKETSYLTEQLLSSAFLEMFGDPVTNPKGWEVTPLGGLLGFLTSGSRGWAEYYSDTGDLFLRIQNVGHDRLDLSDVACVRAPDSAEARRTLTAAGDVLLSITADLGRTAVVPASVGRAFINQHLAILRPKTVNSEYLSAFLASEGGQRQVRRLNRGGVKAGLNFDDIRSVKIVLPPPDRQRAFADIKAHVRSLERQQAGAASNVEDLYSSLGRRAFRGELTTENGESKATRGFAQAGEA